ncbi:hypothetical protein TUSST3_52870 [Streptomyces sp. TUS-ST3]|nr:hypothetical protein TUSST3_52870 [Streptomyces sp. TUS-ST3]
MNSERPDNNDPGEASGGGDGNAAEALGTGAAGGSAKERGSSGAGAEAGQGRTEKTSGAAAGPVEDPEEVADADTDDSPTPDTAAGASPAPEATAPEAPAGPDQPRSAADTATDTAAGADPDGPTAPEVPAGATASPAPEAAAPEAPAGPDQPRSAGDTAGAADSDGSASADSLADDAGSSSASGSTAAVEPDDASVGLKRLGSAAVQPGQSPSPADGTASGPRAGAPADDGAGQGAVEGGLTGSEVTRDGDAGAPRSARRRSPVAIAAVAAAVLVVGGGGAYLAANASGGSGNDTTAGAPEDDTPPPLALDGYGADGGAGNGIAPGEPNPYGATYRADGSLPEGPDSAPVYRVQGQVAEADVTRLAEALGVEGTPVLQGQVWRVGVKDGSGPSLQVNRQAPGAWTFQRYSPVIDNCSSATVCGAQPETPTGPPVSVAVAEKAAAPVLKALGQDTAKLDASQVMGAQRVVNADPAVGGLPTYGWTTGVTVNGQGEVVGGTGQLKAPVKSDSYPVLSAEKTLALLNKVPATDHRMGIGGCASPVPLKDRLEAPCGEPTASPAKSTLTVEKAVFGLASHYVDGRQALVPSWLFEVRSAGAKDAFTVTYPAVDPKYIAAPATATPTSPATPTAPSDEPTSAPKTRDVQVDGYTAEGDELTLTFTGGVCGDYAATASESADEVTAKVTYTPWPERVCIAIAKEMQKTVTLDEPLGARKVVGSDGKEIPLRKAGARLPETSGAR